MAQALRAGLRNGGIRRGGLRPGLGNGSLFAVAPLDLFFARNRTLDPRVTFTRASSGTYVGSDGLLKTATTNEPRFGHNPTTGESLGLLVEEQRTNSIRNNTMVGAVAGTPGTLPTNWSQFLAPTGITRSVVGTGTENGISYVDIRLNGTASGSGELSLFPEASALLLFAAGTTLSASAWLSIVGGSTANISSVRLRVLSYNVGTYLGEGQQTVALTSQLSRYTLNGYTTAATSDRVSYGITTQCIAAGAIDITLRIGLPQLEQGAFATSVISTSGTAATRSADVASITGTNFSSWYRQDAQTWFGEYAPVYNASATVPASTSHLMQVYNLAVGTNNYAIRGANNSVNQEFVARNPTAGAQFANNSGIGFGVAGTNRKVSFGIDSSTLNISTNGAINSVANNAAALMATHDILSIGGGTGGSPPYALNGTIRRLTYWPARLANSTLQQITQ